MSDPPAYAPLPKPGTYRIASVASRTSILEILPYNEERVALGNWADKPNQHWFVQHSGNGYKIKNRQYGLYLSVPNDRHATIVGASKTFTRWILMRTHIGFAIQCGESDQVIDLHTALTHEGNVVLLWPSGGLGPNRMWIFEHLSDDTGGEAADTVEDEVNYLKGELEKKNAQLAIQAEELASKDRQLAEQSHALATALRQLDRSCRTGNERNSIGRLSPDNTGRKPNNAG
ncbi:hypothetical protein FRC12_003754 [Ceratobasidium sp. 428]|nr:hypothetical protein FRC12_003754 [Ceratobasidium sp. 428]